MRTTHSTLIALYLCLLACLSLIQAQMQCGPSSGPCQLNLCCSSDGFCGDSPLHCGDGCQVGFGRCDSGTTTDGSAPSPSPTETALPSSSDIPTTISPMPTTAFSPTPTPVVTTTTTTEETTTTSTTSGTKGTFQFQPTGRPSGASPPQDTGSVHSRIALVVVLLATLLWL